MPTNYVNIVRWAIVKIEKISVIYKVIILLPITPITYIISKPIKNLVADESTVLLSDREDNTYKCLVQDYDETFNFLKQYVKNTNSLNPDFIFSILPENSNFKLLDFKSAIPVPKIKVTKI